MKKITQQEIDIVKEELATRRKEFEKLKFSNLEEQLKWIKDFFNSYIPELEKRYLSEEELKEWIFLPNELRIQFYLFFPEHGLNMANDNQELVRKLIEETTRYGNFPNRFYFSHQD